MKARALPWLMAAIEQAGPFGGADGADTDIPPMMAAAVAAATALPLSKYSATRAVATAAATAVTAAISSQERSMKGGKKRGSGDGRGWDNPPVLEGEMEKVQQGTGEETGGEQGLEEDIVAERGLCRLVQASASTATGGAAW